MFIIGNKEFFTVDELSDMLNIEKEDLIAEITNRTLSGINFDGLWLIPKSAVFDRIKSRENKLFDYELPTEDELPLFQQLNSDVCNVDTLKKFNKVMKKLLNDNSLELDENTKNSTRVTGDSIKAAVAQNIKRALTKAQISYGEIDKDQSRKSVRNLSFTDTNGVTYFLNTVTHREDADFSMPNIISVERLERLYRDDKLYFCVLLISYNIDDFNTIIVNKVNLLPIESIKWEFLNIAALGWAQIQIKNKSFNDIVPDLDQSREKWMLCLCDKVLDFYDKEIKKIKKTRISRFSNAKSEWLKKLSNRKESEKNNTNKGR